MALSSTKVFAVLFLFTNFVHTCSEAAVANAEETPTILNAPAEPTQNAEARIALRQHREATALNRFLFSGNVLEGTGDIVDHWIVMFCPGWHDKCQGLLPSFELLGVQWENKLNKAVMSSSVRFAKIDCATDKALCVSLDVDDYPSVVHYRNNQRVASWHGGAPGLVRFVKQELEGHKRRPSRSASDRSKAKVAPVCAEAGIIIPHSASEFGGIKRNICFVLLLLAVSSSLWTLARSSLRTASKPRKAACQGQSQDTVQDPPCSEGAKRTSSTSGERQTLVL